MSELITYSTNPVTPLSSGKTLKKRLPWIDIARFIDIFLMAYAHVMRGGDFENFSFAIIIPLFCILSGFTFKARTSVKEFVKKDLIPILAPYYIFGLISIMLYAVLGSLVGSHFNLDVDTSVIKNLGGLFYANGQTGYMKYNLPLWFLPTLLCMKLLYNLICNIFKMKYYLVVISVLFVTALGFIYTLKSSYTPLPYDFETACVLLSFYMLGDIISKEKIRKQIERMSRSLCVLLSIVFFWLTLLFTFINEKIDYIGDRYHNIAIFLLTGVAGSFAVILLSMAIKHSKFMEYAGQRTLVILVVHKFPILLLQIIGPVAALITPNNTVKSHIFGLVITFAAVLICLGAEYVITNYMPFLLGRKYTKKPSLPSFAWLKNRVGKGATK